MAGVSVERFILLTDIAGSSRLAEAYPEQYYAALEAHNGVVESSVERHRGVILKNLGDGYLALFDDAASALDAAVAVQLALSAGLQGSIAVFPDGSKLGVRAVVHGGRLTRLAGQEQDWFGPPLNRSARIGKVCHPGQLLISGVVRATLPALPPGLSELDLGRVRLRDLGEPEQLIQLTHPGFAQRQFPPLLGLDSRPNNLALQPNAFIGRDKELAELSRLLTGDTRLLTLHAHGGYGKSRLASQLCAHLLWRFEHGAFEVLLAPVRNHQYLPEAIADATCFQFFGSREPREQILDYLRHKEMLLCLDNFEHLLEGAGFIAEILQTAPKVRILVTSREPLRLTAERVYSVEPLPLGAGSDAVQLFVDRATRVKHRFRLDEESAPLVERICERLEGIPLALELVAAWAGEFTLSQLLSEVERQLEVTARMRDVPERQRSVRAPCDWSYGLLKPELKRALRKLAVFLGGFFVDAAEAALELEGPELRQTLSALCDKSWLFAREVPQLVAGESVPRIRYFLRDAASHEYALQLLSAPENGEEHAQAAAAHARYFAALMER
jgi:predicted ATPase/class 3 adenylate cyclase